MNYHLYIFVYYIYFSFRNEENGFRVRGGIQFENEFSGRPPSAIHPVGYEPDEEAVPGVVVENGDYEIRD